MQASYEMEYFSGRGQEIVGLHYVQNVVWNQTS